MRFSDLTSEFPGATNRLYERLAELRGRGVQILDLVSGNVNEAGIVFPGETLREALDHGIAGANVYRPDSLGQLPARETIGQYEEVPPGQIVITPGTSVSYWYAFKLLCDAGDHVLCPQPSYPLFEYIARLAGIGIRTYRLDEANGWAIDIDHLERQITRHTRAIVLISPHNPTGMVASREQVEHLTQVAARHRLPIVSDEVFREFLADGVEHARPARSEAPLVFTLNGFSKMFALPGLKVGWMAVSGDAALVDRAVKTLELIADTFLPVSEPAQFAVPLLFEKGRPFLDEYRRSMRDRMTAALAALGKAAGVPPRGGFHIVVPVRREAGEEDLALEVLDDENILVHPGYFYDVEGTHVVLALVREPATLAEVLPRLAAHL
jgi:hypothetical protein